MRTAPLRSLALAILATATVAGCTAATTSSDDSSFAGRESSTPGSGGAYDAPSSGASGAPIAGPSGSGGTGTGTGAQVQSGQLTAGVWDDNLNYDFFNGY